MKPECGHPSEVELLQTADGELSDREAARVAAHVRACWSCRARMDAIERTIVGFVDEHQSSLDRQLPPVDGARARLRAELSELAAQGGATPRFFERLQRWSGSGALAAALVLLACSIFAGLRLTQRDQAFRPRPNLTPGDIVALSRSEVCTGEGQPQRTAVPVSLKQAVLREYGIPDPKSGDYELDYLITPQLGGSTSLRNLWPEPYLAEWNARVKDQLEERLHEMVCRGDLDLETAQHDIATDWVSAYRRYLHTRRPLARP